MGATIQWRQRVTGTGTTDVGLYVLDYRPGATSRTTFVALGSQVSWDTRSLAKFTSASFTLDVWKSVLITALSSAPVETGFGRPVTVDNPRVPPIVPANATGQVWLVLVQTQHSREPFVVRCGGTTARGSLTAPAGRASFTNFIHLCGEQDVPQTLTAAELAYCPKS